MKCGTGLKSHLNYNPLQIPDNISFPQFLKENLYLILVAAFLFTLSFVSDNYWSANYNIATAESGMNSYIKKGEKDFSTVTHDTAYIASLVRNKYDENQLKKLLNKEYFIFIYVKDSLGNLKLNNWNTQYIVPDQTILNSPDVVGFRLLENGYYVWNKKNEGDHLAIALIPVKWNYIVTNDYLENVFLSDREIENKYDLVTGTAATGNIKSVNGKVLFHLNQVLFTTFFTNNNLSVICRIMAMLLIFFFLHLAAAYIVKQSRLLYAGTFLFLLIFLLRAVSYLLPIPLNFRQFELFSPLIYASDYIERSLGDLLINAFLALWMIVFLRYYIHQKKIKFYFNHPMYRWVLLVVGVCTILVATYLGSTLIRSLIADSQISFDVINFFSLNIYSAIGFLILSCIAVTYYFLCQVVLYLLKPHFRNPFYQLFLTIICISFIFLGFKIGDINEGFEFYVLAWLLLFMLLLNSAYFYIIASKLVSSRIIFWLFFFSLSISAVIIKENDSKELRNRQHYAEILSAKSNSSGETLLNTMLTDFRADYLADNFYRFFDRKTNRYFKDSLVNNNFAIYTDKYNTRILTFDEHEHALFNEENNSYNDLNSILNTQAKPTSIPGLYYYDQSYDRFSYIVKKTIANTAQNLIGYVFILVSPKNVKTETLYPELFSKGHNNAIENSNTYAFALYSNNQLISSHNDYPFATKIKDPYFAGAPYLLFNRNGHSEMWYDAGGAKYVVIVKEDSLSIQSITLFSYLFCSFLLIAAVYWLFNTVVRGGFDPRKIAGYWQLNIRSQIHGTIIFFSVLSFLVIGIATILFFISRYESNNREKLSSTIRIMQNEVKKTFSAGWLMDDTLLVSEHASRKTIENDINRISEIHGVDVNIYSLNGDLKVSSLPLPYVKGILSKKMEPMAFYHLSNQKEVQFFQKEHIGKLQYLSSYVPVIDSAGNEYAFLNVPYFTSQSRLRDEISNFLVTIINLNAFIFLIAGIVALFITNKITNTFALIGEKMKQINLGKTNEPIEWHRRDEIGDLVNEYNKMVGKLDESAQALAKTERETAWREMARQVAHEIKNPLTPMKLSMQFLQKSIEANAPNVKELSASVAKTLVEQIDHLNHIASEFSQFANIENARLVKFNLNESLISLKELYINQPGLIFNWNLLFSPVIIFSDKTHVNRLFTNLIQNALQAIPEGRTGMITMSERLEGNEVIIEVKDNGTGIDEGTQPKIFTPNFTTKSSGTGLGLAMCRRIVEQANGRIYFITSADEGTRFIVHLPLAPISENKQVRPIS